MTLDLASATKEMFDAHKGTTFLMRVTANETLALELLATEPLSTPAGATRTSFLVRFRAAERRVLPQRTYELEHPVMGAMAIFLVPSGPDAVGMRYDAVFS
jgi:hypothetical protein